jgi:hypothetical protein
MAVPVMAYNDEIIAMVDQRIDSRIRASHAVGSCMNDSSDSGVMVIFDGSSQAIPCKVAGGMAVQANDRVLLTRFGSDWVVTNDYDTPLRNTIASFLGAPVAGTTTSGTYVDFPGPITFTYEKHYSASNLFFNIALSNYVTVNTTTFAIGVLLGDGSGTVDLVRNFFNVANQHMMWTSVRSVAAQPVAGTYTAKLQWARTSGTGVLTVDSNDWISFYMEEIL